MGQESSRFVDQAKAAASKFARELTAADAEASILFEGVPDEIRWLVISQVRLPWERAIPTWLTRGALNATGEGGRRGLIATCCVSQSMRPPDQVNVLLTMDAQSLRYRPDQFETEANGIAPELGAHEVCLRTA